MNLPDATATTCALCGRNIDCEKSDLMGSGWETSVCSECCRQRMLDDGGLLIKFVEPIKDAAFDITEVHVKPGALHYLIESREHCWPFVENHARTGTVFNPNDNPPIDRLPFMEASGHRVSQHKTAKNKKLWIMTDQNGITVVMAPGEF